jgi:AcrR family transcriptional regulator
MPSGTASNYFPSREALLVATARRIVELHHDDMDRTTRHHHTDTAAPAAREGLADRLAALLTDALLAAATTLRTRYRAIYELQLEAVRWPALASALAGLQDSSIGSTADHHGALGLPIPTEAIPTLVTLYGGTLFVLVTTPVDRISRELVEPLAHAIVRGALPDVGGSTTQ